MNAPVSDEIVTLTDEAAEEIKARLSIGAQKAGMGLRIFVEEGGCSGLQYKLLFDNKQPNDLAVEHQGVSVLIDPNSAPHVRGSVIDFSDDLTSGGFHIINPNATESCGCGKSFKH